MRSPRPGDGSLDGAADPLDGLLVKKLFGGRRHNQETLDKRRVGCGLECWGSRSWNKQEVTAFFPRAGERDIYKVKYQGNQDPRPLADFSPNRFI